MSEHTPLKVAILWHMHQPNYQEPGTNHLLLPWVRLHALKDYLDMPLLASRYENLKVTFNLVPGLLEQLQVYLQGGSDNHLDLTRIRAEELTENQKREILNTFFSANPVHMIDPYDHFSQLYRKLQANAEQTVLPALFSSEEMRDIQVWSNLTWIDPMFRDEEPVRSLFNKGKHFTEEDKRALLEWQWKLLAQIVPAYKRLLEQGNVDVSFTAYYHPILPLLCDTHVAREALPTIQLPEQRFAHPEDAERQIAMSMRMYEELFDRPMIGMWPSEGSVSEEVAGICLRLGIRWIATDEEVLYASLTKAGLDRSKYVPHTLYEYGSGLKLFFRDHALSDRIGFVYAGWDADRAAEDCMAHLKQLRQLLINRLDTTIVPIVLDGENAWEYFPNDGHDFLNELYRRLTHDPQIQTVTFSETAASMRPEKLPSLFAGSWINHNFRIWIGHGEDNAAWDRLSAARDTLVRYRKENPSASPGLLAQAWREIYIAEGSDWCWWYGDEHRTSHIRQFDMIYRKHLSRVYELLGLETPPDLLRPLLHGTGLPLVVEPDDLITPEIDGVVTHYYEWAGAGHFDCAGTGGAMHRSEHIVSRILFGYDHNCLYIRLDFADKKLLQSLKEPVVSVKCNGTTPVEVNFRIGNDSRSGNVLHAYRYASRDVVEIAIERKQLWPSGFGRVNLRVGLYDGSSEIEMWPDNDSIRFDIYEKFKELFWPS